MTLLWRSDDVAYTANVTGTESAPLTSLCRFLWSRIPLHFADSMRRTDYGELFR